MQTSNWAKLTNKGMQTSNWTQLTIRACRHQTEHNYVLCMLVHSCSGFPYYIFRLYLSYLSFYWTKYVSIEVSNAHSWFSLDSCKPGTISVTPLFCFIASVYRLPAIALCRGDKTICCSGLTCDHTSMYPVLQAPLWRSYQRVPCGVDIITLSCPLPVHCWGLWTA